MRCYLIIVESTSLRG